MPPVAPSASLPAPPSMVVLTWDMSSPKLSIMPLLPSLRSVELMCLTFRMSSPAPPRMSTSSTLSSDRSAMPSPMASRNA